MVGNVEAPPNEKRIAPKARKKDSKPGAEWVTGPSLREYPDASSIAVLMVMNRQARKVAADAPTASGLLNWRNTD